MNVVVSGLLLYAAYCLIRAMEAAITARRSIPPTPTEEPRP